MESKQGIHFSFEGTSILTDADEHVRLLFAQRNDNRLLLHNYAMVDKIVQTTRELLSQQNTLDNSETTLLAAYFLITGYWFDYSSPVEGSLKVASSFLSKEGYPAKDSNTVLAIINDVFAGGHPSQGACLLSDARTICVYINDYPTNHALLRLEREFLLGKSYNRMEWARAQLEELLRQKLCTPYAQKSYQHALSESVLLQKLRIEKEERSIPSTALTSLEKPLFKGLDDRSMQTFFRSNYRNHINLSSIADKKASMLISVNSIIISLLITFLSYRNIAATNPIILIPVIIFLVTGLTSLIFAVLSVRPKVTTVNKGEKEMGEIKKNIAFFGNFVHLSLPQYEKAIDEVFREEDLLVGNMVRDLYFLGQVLDRKYRYLTVSYNIFMIGFITTVLLFIFILLK